jgi:hypothetical protein
VAAATQYALDATICSTGNIWLFAIAVGKNWLGTFLSLQVKYTPQENQMRSKAGLVSDVFHRNLSRNHERSTRGFFLG